MSRPPLSFTRAYTALITKSEKSDDANKHNNVRGYRPITLINVFIRLCLRYLREDGKP